jgi:membrane-associated phospholipid phosphatase
MAFIIGFFHHLPRNVIDCFRGYNLLFHGLAAALTFLCVATGFDWFYFEFFRGSVVRGLFFPAIVIGFFLPILAPPALFMVGKRRGHAGILNTACAVGQAALLGLLISSTYKAFTGRVPPSYFRQAALTDTSHGFQFGFLRGGLFWGWPSSHTTVAFAMAVAVWVLYPRRAWVRAAALLYAFYIGIGVSISIHWFSDFMAGAIVGAVIGSMVGKSFTYQNSK